MLMHYRVKRRPKCGIELYGVFCEIDDAEVSNLKLIIA